METYGSIFFVHQYTEPSMNNIQNFYFNLYIIPIEFILCPVYNNLNKAKNNKSKHLDNSIDFILWMWYTTNNSIPNIKGA